MLLEPHKSCSYCLIVASFWYIHMIFRLFSILLFLLSSKTTAFCFTEAGNKYRIDPLLLYSVAVVESHLNPRAIGNNYSADEKKITSSDYGLMQINDSHIHKLKMMGIIKDKRELLDNPCLNVQIGAWIMSQHFNQCGVNWQCLGSYNAGFADSNALLRLRYAKKVFSLYSQYKRMLLRTQTS